MQQYILDLEEHGSAISQEHFGNKFYPGCKFHAATVAMNLIKLGWINSPFLPKCIIPTFVHCDNQNGTGQAHNSQLCVSGIYSTVPEDLNSDVPNKDSSWGCSLCCAYQKQSCQLFGVKYEWIYALINDIKEWYKSTEIADKLWSASAEQVIDKMQLWSSINNKNNNNSSDKVLSSQDEQAARLYFSDNDPMVDYYEFGFRLLNKSFLISNFVTPIHLLNKTCHPLHLCQVLELVYCIVTCISIKTYVDVIMSWVNAKTIPECNFTEAYFTTERELHGGLGVGTVGKSIKQPSYNKKVQLGVVESCLQNLAVNVCKWQDKADSVSRMKPKGQFHQFCQLVNSVNANLLGAGPLGAQHIVHTLVLLNVIPIPEFASISFIAKGTHTASYSLDIMVKKCNYTQEEASNILFDDLQSPDWFDFHPWNWGDSLDPIQ